MTKEEIEKEVRKTKATLERKELRRTMALNALKAKKELKTMDKIIFGLACLTVTAVFIAIYGAALNAAI